VIVGGGPVSSRLLRELLQRAPALPVVTYDCEPWGPYDRVELGSVLSGELGWADLDNTFLLPEEHHVVRRHALITAIDRENRTVTDLHRQQQAYSTLVLVTGSYTNVPSFPGAHLKGIYTLHDKSDLKRLLNRRKDSRRIVVMGGGVLGVETACALQTDSTTVYILQNDRLMKQQLDQRASAILLDRLRAFGIQVILDRAKEILGGDTVTGIRTYSGELVECDAIVLATGVQPGAKLALKAGLKVGRGIKVNDQMQTSDPCIYAVGDCAEHRGRVYGLALQGLSRQRWRQRTSWAVRPAIQGRWR
jgi:nitrite reductase (NADH) large subunit